MLHVHLKPKPLVIVDWFKFTKECNMKKRVWQSTINVTWNNLVTHCAWYWYVLNYALCDQIVNGLCQDSIQRKLLTEDELTFKKTCEVDQDIELAERKTYKLKATTYREVQAVSDKHKSVKKGIQHSKSALSPGAVSWRDLLYTYAHVTWIRDYSRFFHVL